MRARYQNLAPDRIQTMVKQGWPMQNIPLRYCPVLNNFQMKQKHISEMIYLKKYYLFHFIVMSSTCQINCDKTTPHHVQTGV
jgi:hypothetical protein